MQNFWVIVLLYCAVLGESSTDPIIGVLGQTVILPCQQTLPPNTEVPTVEWSKPGLSKYILVLQNMFEKYDEKHPDFEFRTHLFLSQVQNGNFSLRISDLRMSDAGKYICKTIWTPKEHSKRELELEVVDIPTPELSVLSSNGEVSLSCNMTVRLLEPRMTFWDGHGNVLEEQKTEITNIDGYYRVEKRVTAPSTGKSVTCRVEFAEVSQSREAHMLIRDWNKESCVLPMVYSAIGSGLGVLVIVLGIVFVVQICKSDKQKIMSRQSTEESAETNVSESQRLLNQDSVDSCIVQISETQCNSLTQEPDLNSSTSSSIHSKIDRKNGSVQSIFPDANANICSKANADVFSDGIDASAKCAITDDSKSVQYKKTITRQNASDYMSSKDCLVNFNKGQANGISLAPKKRCALRSQSLSDSYPASNQDVKNHYRRCSLSVLTQPVRFEQLQEEPEKSIL